MQEPLPSIHAVNEHSFGKFNAASGEQGDFSAVPQQRLRQKSRRHS
jgi:hypothetical protein